jgi:hypothetical protein
MIREDAECNTQLPKLCFRLAISMLRHPRSYPSAMLSMLFHHAIYALPPRYLHSSAVLSMPFSTVRVMLQQCGRNVLNIKSLIINDL